MLTCSLACSLAHLPTYYLTPPRTTGAGGRIQEDASRRSAPSSDEEAWWRRGGGPLRAKGPSSFDEARWAHRSRRGEAGRAVARWRGAWRGARRGARGGPSSLEGGPWCVSVVCECCVCRVCKLHSNVKALLCSLAFPFLYLSIYLSIYLLGAAGTLRRSWRRSSTRLLLQATGTCCVRVTYTCGAARRANAHKKKSLHLTCSFFSLAGTRIRGWGGWVQSLLEA